MLTTMVRAPLRKFYPKEVDEAVSSLLKQTGLPLERCIRYAWGMMKGHFEERIFLKDVVISIRVKNGRTTLPSHDNYTLVGDWLVEVEVTGGLR